MFKSWGIEQLAHKIYEESIGEMKYADKIIDWILLIDGLPNLQDIHKLKIEENVPEMMECDLSAELNNQQCLKKAISICEQNSDFVSCCIFQEILDETEDHIDWLEAQINLIKTVGIENYIQEQIFKNDD